MVRYHVNPETKKPGVCSAGIKCEFDDGDSPQHGDTPSKAMEKYAEHHGLDKKALEGKRKRTLADIRDTPTKEDYDKAREGVLIDFANRDLEVSWRKLMPPRSRMTDKNNKEYYSKVEEIAATKINLDSAIGQRANIYAEMSAYGRAFTEGVKIPQEVSDHFEKIWAGEEEGLSEAQACKELAGNKQALKDLLAGRITPGSIVGSGYKNPKKIAVEYLTRVIEEYSRAIETRGRSYSINVANAEYKTRTDENELTGSA